MIRALIPIFAVLIAVALFFTYIQPTFEEIGAIQDEAFEYKEAIDKAGELRRLVQELTATRNSIPLAELERLEALLPDSVDEISSLIDLDALAETHDVALGGLAIVNGSGEVSLEDIQDEFENGSARSGQEGDIPYTSLSIGFNIAGSYDQFRAFLKDLERSLVLHEITELQFDATGEDEDGGGQTYRFVVELYALN